MSWASASLPRFTSVVDKLFSTLSPCRCFLHGASAFSVISRTRLKSDGVSSLSQIHLVDGVESFYHVRVIFALSSFIDRVSLLVLASSAS